LATVYHIPDEPRPGGLAHVTVNPFWPMLCVMFVGAGMSWTWFLLNGIAMGSPTRKRELALAVGGLFGNLVLLIGVGETYDRLGIDGKLILPYLWLVVLVWKLGVSYVLYMLQAGSFGIYEYYGGNVQNGWIGLILAYLAWNMLLAPAMKNAPLIVAALS
jgi:hypothetical protein